MNPASENSAEHHLTAELDNDEHLMARIADGDESAFRTLVDRYGHMIYDLCYKYLGHAEDAEEVAQDVFIRLFKSAAAWEPRAKLSTYLYRIAVNLSLNRIRDNKRRRLFSLNSMKGTPASAVTPDWEQPDRQLVRKETAARVRSAIDSLPEKQKSVLILRRYHEKSYQEIAEITGCSIQSVESRLFRARQKLKLILGDIKE